MRTLQQTGIQAICKNIEKLQKIILLAPLSWTEEDVIIAYPSYKYNQLISIYSEFVDYDELLKDFEFKSNSEMSHELRSVLLNIDFL